MIWFPFVLLSPVARASAGREEAQIDAFATLAVSEIHLPSIPAVHPAREVNPTTFLGS